MNIDLLITGICALSLCSILMWGMSTVIGWRDTLLIFLAGLVVIGIILFGVYHYWLYEHRAQWTGVH